MNESELCKQIKNSRKIKEASCNTYLSALKKIKKGMGFHNDLELKNTEFLQDFDKVMKVIHNENKITSKKNKLTAILVALGSDNPKNTDLIDKYGNELKNLNETYMNFLKTQKKTETQKKNWITYNQLIKIINKIMKQVEDKDILKKDELSSRDFDLLQQYVILRTYIEFPLRNDFANMPVITLREFKKLSKDKRNDKNYLVMNGKNKKEFHINQFKNSKYIGSKILKVSNALSKLINLWLKHNKSGYYLVKLDQISPMTPNIITKYLNKIFIKHTGKKISTSMIRHIVISHMLKNDKTIKQKEKENKEIENKFLHSNNINQLYRKID